MLGAAWVCVQSMVGSWVLGFGFRGLGFRVAARLVIIGSPCAVYNMNIQPIRVVSILLSTVPRKHQYNPI